MAIILDNINYIYSEGTAYQRQALKNINLQIKDGEFIGLIGHTGSGKSTLTQHLNGLIKATLKLDREISSGDGLKIINSKTNSQIASLGVGNVEKISTNEFIIYTKNKFETGLDVHLTQSAKNEERSIKYV